MHTCIIILLWWHPWFMVHKLWTINTDILYSALCFTGTFYTVHSMIEYQIHPMKFILYHDTMACHQSTCGLYECLCLCDSHCPTNHLQPNLAKLPKPPIRWWISNVPKISYGLGDRRPCCVVWSATMDHNLWWQVGIVSHWRRLSRVWHLKQKENLFVWYSTMVLYGTVQHYDTAIAIQYCTVL